MQIVGPIFGRGDDLWGWLVPANYLLLSTRIERSRLKMQSKGVTPSLFTLEI
jgi:hypothetical protein